MSNVEESTISSVSTTILQGDACNGNIGIHSAGTPVGFSVSPAPALTLYFASNARSADTVTLFLVSRAAVEQFGAILGKYILDTTSGTCYNGCVRYERGRNHEIR